MCDIKNKTLLKTMTVYKAVGKTNTGDYISPFAHAPITTGKVPFFTISEIKNWWYNTSHPLHGKVSGFARKRDAEILSNHIKANPFAYPENMKILKIKLGGTILIGTTNMILHENILSWNHITYAGSEILSIEEIEEA